MAPSISGAITAHLVSVHRKAEVVDLFPFVVPFIVCVRPLPMTVMVL